MKRFIVFKGSASSHCCFVATVMDKSKPLMIGGEHYKDDSGEHYESVCECFSLDYANVIADALNKGELCLI
jgi:hypothetical protein